MIASGAHLDFVVPKHVFGGAFRRGPDHAGEGHADLLSEQSEYLLLISFTGEEVDERVEA